MGILNAAHDAVKNKHKGPNDKGTGKGSVIKGSGLSHFLSWFKKPQDDQKTASSSGSSSSGSSSSGSSSSGSSSSGSSSSGSSSSGSSSSSSDPGADFDPYKNWKEHWESNWNVSPPKRIIRNYGEWMEEDSEEHKNARAIWEQNARTDLPMDISRLSPRSRTVMDLPDPQRSDPDSQFLHAVLGRPETFISGSRFSLSHPDFKTSNPVLNHLRNSMFSLAKDREPPHDPYDASMIKPIEFQDDRGDKSSTKKRYKTEVRIPSSPTRVSFFSSEPPPYEEWHNQDYSPREVPVRHYGPGKNWFSFDTHHLSMILDPQYAARAIAGAHSSWKAFRNQFKQTNGREPEHQDFHSAIQRKQIRAIGLPAEEQEQKEVQRNIHGLQMAAINHPFVHIDDLVKILRTKPSSSSNRQEKAIHPWDDHPPGYNNRRHYELEEYGRDIDEVDYNLMSRHYNQLRSNPFYKKPQDDPLVSHYDNLEDTLLQDKQVAVIRKLMFHANPGYLDRAREQRWYGQNSHTPGLDPTGYGNWANYIPMGFPDGHRHLITRHLVDDRRRTTGTMQYLSPITIQAADIWRSLYPDVHPHEIDHRTLVPTLFGRKIEHLNIPGHKYSPASAWRSVNPWRVDRPAGAHGRDIGAIEKQLEALKTKQKNESFSHILMGLKHTDPVVREIARKGMHRQDPPTRDEYLKYEDNNKIH